MTARSTPIPYLIGATLLLAVCNDEPGGFAGGSGTDGDEGGSCVVGTEGCPCTGGGACDPGLECRSGLCVDPGDGDGASDSTDDGDGGTASSSADGTHATGSSQSSTPGTSTGSDTTLDTGTSGGPTTGTNGSATATTSSISTTPSTGTTSSSSSPSTSTASSTDTTTSSDTTASSSDTTTPTPTCSTLLVNNDGSWEQYYGWAPPTTVTSGVMVERFTPSSYPFTLCEVDACWAARGVATGLSYEIVIYDDNGGSGGPGTLLGAVGSSEANVPIVGQSYTVDVASEGVTITSGSVFVGVRWNPQAYEDMRICIDESITTAEAEGWWAGNLSAFSVLRDAIANYRALGIAVRGSG